MWALQLRAPILLIVNILTPAYAQPTLVLDVGHDPVKFGATSASGRTEHDFNVDFALELAQVLEEHGVETSVYIASASTGLADRVADLRGITGCALISIHHDSVQEIDLRETDAFGRMTTYTDSATGFSIFVSPANGNYEGSLSLATNIGRRLKGAGFAQNLYHGLDIPGEGRALLDMGGNVYEYSGLAVLKSEKRPAILIEIAVIKNPLDEARVRDPKYRQSYIGEMARAILEFKKNCPQDF